MVFKSILSFHLVYNDMHDLFDIIEFSKNNSSHLDIVIMVPFIRPVVAGDGMVTHDTMLEQNQELSKKAKQQRQALLEYAEKQRVSLSVCVEIADRLQFRAIMRNYANCADALILMRSEINNSDIAEKVFISVLMDTSCPTVLLSGKSPVFKDLNNVLVAWDGGATAATSVRQALPILQVAQKVTLVSIDPKPAKEGDAPGHDMALYLSRHGVTVDVDLIPSAGKSVAHALFQAAEDIDADIVVMGGYGRSRLSEWILGGTTRETLSDAKRTVFLSH
ncbi:universal stress protein [Amylibacter sp. SFDW26]|uniref:universal stress protein n=1 Tax=Amylibacter sp. SFDW26 TaxID=2652722 RepID=UPI0012623F76|nr:universal stress protein [Amylibacter sp. SFDW26]KAB7614437.1 universal stress protein [Amylibacter sp. SFDW26]